MTVHGGYLSHDHAVAESSVTRVSRAMPKKRAMNIGATLASKFRRCAPVDDQQV